MQYIILECNLRLIGRFVKAHDKTYSKRCIFEVNMNVNDKQLTHNKMQRELKLFKSVLFTLTFLPMTWFLMKFR